MSPVSQLLDGAPDLREEDPLPSNLTVMPRRDAEASRTIEAVAPRRSLGDYISGVEAIVDTIESLDQLDESDEAARLELSTMLIAELAGTRKKVDNVSAALSTFESLEASAAKEIERLDARRKRFARCGERLADYVLATMEASKLPKLEGDFSTLARRLNPPSVRIDDASLVPAEFMRTPPTPAPVPDKAALGRSLKGGEVVSGCRLVSTCRLVRS